MAWQSMKSATSIRRKMTTSKRQQHINTNRFVLNVCSLCAHTHSAVNKNKKETLTQKGDSIQTHFNRMNTHQKEKQTSNEEISKCSATNQLCVQHMYDVYEMNRCDDSNISRIASMAKKNGRLRKWSHRLAGDLA